MDDDENKPKHRHQRCRGWQFTFFGETSNSLEEQENQTELAAELTQNKLLFPLSSTQVGDRLIIAQILSGKGMMRQLSKNGLILGVEVRVISKTASGSIIVSIGDRQVGLGAGMANKVMVTAIENNY